MKVIINDTTYFVDWIHNNYRTLDPSYTNKKILLKGAVTSGGQKFNSTDCFIVLPENEDGLVFSYKGQAVLSDKDNYNRNKGRKISLQKALKFAFTVKDDKKILLFTKEERREFWKAYYKMRGKW